jgi:hypothetical protein
MRRALELPTLATIATLGATLGAGVLAVGLMAGCPDRGISEVNPNQDKVEVKDIPLQLNRNLDLLFVVDNSGSMKEEQTGLTANFPKFIDVLSQIQGGLPDVHIGVVSTNVGAGNNNIQYCPSGGDLGHLRQGETNNATTCGLNSGEKFVSDVAQTGGGRMQNYTGNLSTVFQCMATLGTQGCGLEQPLESLREALTPSNSFNTGFIRSDAYLGIVIISDEDDCSTMNTAMFDPNANMGPINFRCTKYGVQCDGDPDLLNYGTYTGCVPKKNSQYMYDVDDYVTFVKGLKTDPKSIVVAGILGNPDPFAVYEDPMMAGQPALKPSCNSANGNAVPAIRSYYFTQQFPDRNSYTTICADDLSDALVSIAGLLKEVIGDPCIQGDLKDTDPNTAGVQPDCKVSQEAGGVETPLPECDPFGPGTHTVTPCWYLDTDATQCASTTSMLKLVTDYGGGSAPTDTHILAQCVVD